MGDILSEYLCLDDSQKKNEFGSFVKALKKNAESNPEEALSIIRQVPFLGLDFSSVRKLYTVFESAAGKTDRVPGKKVKIAVAGSSTTTQLTWLLKLFLFCRGINPEVYESEYGVFRQEIMDINSGLYKFAPEVVFIATTHRDIQYPILPGQKNINENITRETEFWNLLWKKLFDCLSCTVIQNNFDIPPLRPLGNLEASTVGLGTDYIRRLNVAMADAAPDYVLLHDLDGLASEAGRNAWFDDRFYFYSKVPCAVEALPEYAYSVSAMIGALFGFTKKCLVLDLDNTLWGGVIGDDGLDNIVLGEADPVGEAYKAFQKYALELKKRGIILAVCSKNEDANARAPFIKHPEMVLKLDDISCFVANWQDKPANLRVIAKTLNIGLDSLVFVDDNPAERMIVRQLLPEVSVPELPSDPALYSLAVDKHRYFEQVSLTAEDLNRAAMYASESARKECESSAENLDDFLSSLGMELVIAPFDNESVNRIVQLINKSNQYNLTTKRRTKSEILEIMDNGKYLPLSLRLKDRFGDYGLISVFIGECEARKLICDTWLMSCRVLERGVEFELMNRLVALCREKNVATISGDYIPTSKNGLVKNHYEKLGFKKISETPDGVSRWEYNVSPGPAPFETHIKVAEKESV